MIGRTALLAAAVASLTLGTAANANIVTDLQIRIGMRNSRPPVERVWVAPVYETRVERVWVEPVFETRGDRVWHEAVYEDRCDRVLVPDRWETRREESRDYHGRRYTREVRVLIEPAHYEDRPSHVLVREGYWEEAPQRVCVSDGHWAETTRQVCVRDGYWAETPVACATPESRIQIGLERTVGRDHDDRHDDWRDRGDDRRDDHRDGRYDRGGRH
jgi:hypothetical protein